MNKQSVSEYHWSSNPSDIQTKGTKTEVFQFKHGTIFYSNSLVNDQADLNKDDNFEVKNFFCTHADGRMMKTTQVVINEKQLLLHDQFLLQPKLINGQPSDHPSSSSKDPLSFNKRNNYMKNGEVERHDTKNLPKNIVTLFVGWLKKQAKKNEVLECRRVKKRVNSKIKSMRYYNKSLLDALAKDEGTARQFVRFCEESGERMIDQSKIKDKESHKMALHNYKKIFQLQIAPI